MSDASVKAPQLDAFYQEYLNSEMSARFVARFPSHYTLGTLARSGRARQSRHAPRGRVVARIPRRLRIECRRGPRFARRRSRRALARRERHSGTLVSRRFGAAAASVADHHASEQCAAFRTGGARSHHPVAGSGRFRGSVEPARHRLVSDGALRRVQAGLPDTHRNAIRIILRRRSAWAIATWSCSTPWRHWKGSGWRFPSIPTWKTCGPKSVTCNARWTALRQDEARMAEADECQANPTARTMPASGFAIRACSFPACSFIRASVLRHYSLPPCVARDLC